MNGNTQRSYWEMKALFKASEIENTYMLTSGCLFNIPEVLLIWYQWMK